MGKLQLLLSLLENINHSDLLEHISFAVFFWQNKGKANKHEIWGIANKRFDDFRRKLWYLKFFPKNAHYFTIQGLSNVRYRHIKEKGFTGGIAVCSCFINTPINFVAFCSFFPCRLTFFHRGRKQKSGGRQQKSSRADKQHCFP